MPTVAIIMPLLNEIKALPETLAALCRLGAEQLIIVDGGSTDGSREWLQRYVSRNAIDTSFQNVIVLDSAPGRARQMNAGAAVAETEILLFVHADTLLPDQALASIGDARWGRFDVTFHDNCSPYSRSLALVQSMMNWRSRITGIATGDQAIFVQRALFQQVAGFDNIPIMEDVALSKKLRQIYPPSCLRDTVQTSARRWRQHGVWRTITLMWALRLAYAIGVSPTRLQALYQQVR